jgi:thioredoxin-dependent peroxiredoxin
MRIPRQLVAAAAAAAAALLAGPAAAQSQAQAPAQAQPPAQNQAPAPPVEPTLKVGDKAPAFAAVADDGKLWKSADHVGKKVVVVYFYPAAMTGGCTKQACSFRDNHTKLDKAGATVVGVSGDRIANLKAFKGANQLNFPLLADSTGTVAKAFGVPLGEGGSIKRTVDGQEIELTRDVTAARWTFVIGKDGKVAFLETAVNPAGDGEAVLAAVEKLPRK